MELMKISIISVILVIVIIMTSYLIYKAYKKFEEKIIVDPNIKNKKFKCASGPCEIIIDSRKIKGKFCDFHKHIQKYHLILVSNNDPLQNKSMMYMSTNGQMFKNESQNNKIYNNLNNQAKKYK